MPSISAPPRSDESRETFDAVEALENAIGAPALVDILKSYVATAEQLCRTLEAASQEADWEGTMHLAQDVAVRANGLGFAAMASVAREFVMSAREGEPAHALRNDAQMVVIEHERLRLELENLYPELVA